MGHTERPTGAFAFLSFYILIIVGLELGEINIGVTKLIPCVSFVWFSCLRNLTCLKKTAFHLIYQLPHAACVNLAASTGASWTLVTPRGPPHIENGILLFSSGPVIGCFRLPFS
jgi:hypothetical protein